MQPSTRIGLIVIVLCIFGMGLIYEMKKPGPSDTELINQQLITAVDASNAGSSQHLLSVVSQDYKDTSGTSRTEVAAVLNRGLQNDRELVFQITKPRIQVTGNSGTSDFTLMITDSHSGAKLATRDMHVVWRRETARKWIIFSQPNWLAVSSDLSPESLMDQ